MLILSRRKRSRRYRVALLAYVTAAALSLAVTAIEIIQADGFSHYMYLLPTLAVFISALAGGFGPGLAAGALSGLGVCYAVVVEQGSFGPNAFMNAMSLGIFLATSVAISKVVDSLGKQARRAEEAKRRVEFLADAGQALSVNLNPEDTLKTVARLIVPSIADWCIIDLIGENDEIMRVAVAAADLKKEQVLNELQRLYPARWGSPQPGARAIMSGQSIFIDSFTDQHLTTTVCDDRHLEIMRKLDPRSLIAVPLISRGRTVGAVAMCYSESERKYSREDVDFAESLALRMATAVDNALLYSDAQKAFKARNEFLSMAVHELRSPVAALRLRTHILRKLIVDRPDVTDLVDGAELELTKLSKLIGDVFDVSRIETKQLRLERERVDLCEIVSHVISGMSAEIQAAGCVVRLDAPLPVIGYFDRVRIEQVVRNLLGNAIKYGRNKPVDVLVEAAGGYGRLVVEDHGPGIAKESQGRIFERYERLDADKNIAGLGLGLFIVREISRAHQGEIELESAPDRGARFAVKLPLGASASVAR